MMKATQKIAILGNMNELGDYSKSSHIEVGAYCDPKQLDLVVTIGPDANQYLAPAAVEQGCLVKTFDDPYAAGEFVKTEVKAGAVLLAKGSQNNVYAEEAIRSLLANPNDANRLVRQSPAWQKVKRKNFKK
jgi:UDP-N-acetylmuramyl pentapeptide synthase